MTRGMRDARLAIHAALTGVMAWLALVLALPGDTFGTSPTFALMQRLGSEDGWAMVFWLVASIGLTGLGSTARWWRLASVLALSTAHGVVAILFVLGNPLTTATGTYAVLALLGYYLAWRRTDEGL